MPIDPQALEAFIALGRTLTEEGDVTPAQLAKLVTAGRGAESPELLAQRSTQRIAERSADATNRIRVIQGDMTEKLRRDTAKRQGDIERLTLQQSIKREETTRRLRAIEDLMTRGDQAARHLPPGSGELKSITDSLKELGPEGKSGAAQIEAIAVENQRLRVRGAERGAAKRFRVAGETVPSDLRVNLKAADDAGTSLMNVVADELTKAKEVKLGVAKEARIKVSGEEIARGARVTAFGDVGDDALNLAKQIDELTPEAQKRKIKGARGKAKIGRAGVFGIGGVLGALIISSLGKSIFGGKAKGEPEIDPQMQLLLAAQLQKAQSGETLQQGRQLRNVATLLGIIKQLRETNAMQGSQTSLPAII